MDPFLTIIPDDRGQEIRELVRERDGFDSEGKDNEVDLTRRPTVNTVAHLPLAGDGQVGEQEVEQEVESPPMPEHDLDQYYCERLETGLRYINGAVKRRITPRT